MSGKLSLKDSRLLLSHLPLPSKGYPTHQKILHKRRVEKAEGMYVPSPLGRHLLYRRTRAQRRYQDPGVSPITAGWNSGCLFSLCTRGGDQRPGCGGNLLTTQQSSDSSFQDRQWRGMRKGLSCKALFFPLYFEVSYHWYEYPNCTSRHHHTRTGVLSLIFLRHWLYPSAGHGGSLASFQILMMKSSEIHT